MAARDDYIYCSEAYELVHLQCRMPTAVHCRRRRIMLATVARHILSTASGGGTTAELDAICEAEEISSGVKERLLAKHGGDATPNRSRSCLPLSVPHGLFFDYFYMRNK